MKEASQRKTRSSRAASFSSKEPKTSTKEKDRKMDKIFKQGQDFAKKLHTEEIVP